MPKCPTCGQERHDISGADFERIANLARAHAARTGRPRVTREMVRQAHLEVTGRPINDLHAMYLVCTLNASKLSKED